jgi:hypothetical protein
MSYAYWIDQDENLLVVKFWGEIPYPEEAEAVLSILDDPRIQPGIKILVDRTESSFASSPQDVRTHVEQVAKKIAALGEPRVANVVSADLDYGMIRMFMSVSDGKLDHDFSVFRDIQEACDWLRIDAVRIEWPREPEGP